MKSIFIKFYGSLSLNILIGALIDLGVPFPFLQSELHDINSSLSAESSENHKTQVPARYFAIAGNGDFPLLSADKAREEWDSLVQSRHEEWKELGDQVIAHLEEVRKQVQGDAEGALPLNSVSLAALYLFFDSLDYLQADSVFACPFSLTDAETEKGKMVKFLLHDALTTTGDVFKPEGMEPLAAAVIKTLSQGFIPMDGRFLLERTAYGTSNAEHPDGSNTGALFLGYFHDREESVFGKNIKIFGVDIQKEDDF